MKFLGQILVSLLSTNPEINQRLGKLMDFLKFMNVSGKHYGNECLESLFRAEQIRRWLQRRGQSDGAVGEEPWYVLKVSPRSQSN